MEQVKGMPLLIALFDFFKNDGYFAPLFYLTSIKFPELPKHLKSISPFDKISNKEVSGIDIICYFLLPIFGKPVAKLFFEDFNKNLGLGLFMKY